MCIDPKDLPSVVPVFSAEGEGLGCLPLKDIYGVNKKNTILFFDVNEWHQKKDTEKKIVLPSGYTLRHWCQHLALQWSVPALIMAVNHNLTHNLCERIKHNQLCAFSGTEFQACKNPWTLVKTFDDCKKHVDEHIKSNGIDFPMEEISKASDFLWKGLQENQLKIATQILFYFSAQEYETESISLGEFNRQVANLTMSNDLKILAVGCEGGDVFIYDYYKRALKSRFKASYYSEIDSSYNSERDLRLGSRAPDSNPYLHKVNQKREDRIERILLNTKNGTCLVVLKDSENYFKGSLWDYESGECLEVGIGLKEYKEFDRCKENPDDSNINYRAYEVLKHGKTSRLIIYDKCNNNFQEVVFEGDRLFYDPLLAPLDDVKKLCVNTQKPGCIKVFKESNTSNESDVCIQIKEINFGEDAQVLSALCTPDGNECIVGTQNAVFTAPLVDSFKHEMRKRALSHNDACKLLAFYDQYRKDHYLPVTPKQHQEFLQKFKEAAMPIIAKLDICREVPNDDSSYLCLLPPEILYKINDYVGHPVKV